MLSDNVHGSKQVSAVLSSFSSFPVRTMMRELLEAARVSRREEVVEKKSEVKLWGRFRLHFTCPLRSKRTRMVESM